MIVLASKKAQCHKWKISYRQQATGFGSTTPAVYTAWKIPSRFTRLVISRINTGATLLDRSFLWTQRKLISTIKTVLKEENWQQMVWDTFCVETFSMVYIYCFNYNNWYTHNWLVKPKLQDWLILSDHRVPVSTHTFVRKQEKIPIEIHYITKDCSLASFQLWDFRISSRLQH